MKKEVKLVFPEDLVCEPILYYLGKDFNVSYSISSANVDVNSGWVILSLEGEEKKIERAIRNLEEKGVIVERR
ncbi:MAG: NIL domain-containing protein [bacterium]